MNTTTLNEVLQITGALMAVGMPVYEANYGYQYLVVRKIKATGKPVEQLTIGEVTVILETAREEFNAISNRDVNSLQGAGK